MGTYTFIDYNLVFRSIYYAVAMFNRPANWVYKVVSTKNRHVQSVYMTVNKIRTPA